MVEAVDIIRRVYEGFNRDDIRPLLESLDPDVSRASGSSLAAYNIDRVHIANQVGPLVTPP